MLSLSLRSFECASWLENDDGSSDKIINIHQSISVKNGFELFFYWKENSTGWMVDDNDNPTILLIW